MSGSFLLPWMTAGTLLLLGACSARRSEPITGQTVSSRSLHEGRVLFMEHCHKCHPGGEGGLGPSLNDKPLPKVLIKTQVRVGLGAMPSFPPETISERELDELVAYLKALRALRPAKSRWPER